MTHLSRRRLLQGIAGASATSLILPVWAAKPKKKIGVALLGLGGYSRDLLAPGLQLTEYCELRGIVTGSPEKIPEWQKKYGIADKNVYSYETLPEIADNPDIDVVYVVTPTFLHKKFSVMAAEAGKHVWCEKPMAMTVDECQAIIDACAMGRAVVEKPVMIIAHTVPGKGVPFMEYDYHWHGAPPNSEQAKEALKKLRSLDGKIRGEHE